MMHMMGVGDTMETIPTIGFNCEVVEYKDEKLSIWYTQSSAHGWLIDWIAISYLHIYGDRDVGGKKEVRVLWRSYFDHRPDALIFVVDASVKERFEEAREFLHSVMADDRFESTCKHSQPIPIPIPPISDI